MENIKYQYVYNRKKVLNKEGKALIQLKIYIYAGGKAQNYYLSTGIYIAPNEWNENERIIKKNENQKALNQQLSTLVNKLQNAEIEQRRKGHIITFEYLKQVHENRQSESFLLFCEKELRLQMLKDATKDNHLATFAKLRQYEKAYKVSLYFSDINLSFLEGFEKWCKENALSQNSLIRHLQVIKAYFNRAINKDVIDAKFYPFRKYKLKSTKTSIPFLEKNELQLLENLDRSAFSEIQNNILDLFLFACYTGLRFADAKNVKKEAIKQVNGENFLLLYASKTDKETRISLDIFQGKALTILQRNISNAPTIFSHIKNVYANRHLKIIAEKAGIEKNVHFHVSRHTFATTLLNAKISLVSVQKLLGHSDIATTQIYAEMLDETIHNELKNSNI